PRADVAHRDRRAGRLARGPPARRRRRRARHLRPPLALRRGRVLHPRTDLPRARAVPGTRIGAPRRAPRVRGLPPRPDRAPSLPAAPEYAAPDGPGRVP